MHPDLEKMVPLQELDGEAQRLREELAAAPKRVAEGEARLRTAQASRERLAHEVSSEQTVARRLESELADLRTKLERAGKKIDSATTTAQVTALEHETAFLRAEISRLEDLELASMERSEALETQTPAAQQQIAHVSGLLATERERTQALLAQDKAALSDVNRQREQLRAQIMQSPTGEASLSHYDRVAGHRGAAISEALRGKCNACGMMVRPQLWHDLQDNSPESPAHESLVSCENCGRLLYYDPARDAPQRKAVQGDSIAAAIVRSSI